MSVVMGGNENRGETLIVPSVVVVQVFSFPGIFARISLPLAVGVLHASSLWGMEWLQNNSYLWQ